MLSKKSVGRSGEELAESFLIRRKYKIIEKNYCNRFGELDIIASDRGTLCFIEVKTRRSTYHGSPFEAVTKKKQYKLAQVALQYLKDKKSRYRNARFDVVAVTGVKDGENSIEIIKNAFDLTDIKYG